LTFERVGEREWTLLAEMSDKEGTVSKNTVEGIRFNTDGSFNSIASGDLDAQRIVIDFGSAAETQTIMLNFGESGQFDGLTTFGGASTAAVTEQDGYAAGALKSVSIGRDGVIQGIYTNGQRRSVATLQVGTFDNPEGLENLGNGLWGSTVNSGDPVLGNAMAGRAGAVASSVLEASNVESAAELTKLIVAQQGFQMSARALAVNNRIVQELATII
jgi:flagellar hook protein FlgE